MFLSFIDVDSYNIFTSRPEDTTFAMNNTVFPGIVGTLSTILPIALSGPVFQVRCMTPHGLLSHIWLCQDIEGGNPANEEENSQYKVQVHSFIIN